MIIYYEAFLLLYNRPRCLKLNKAGVDLSQHTLQLNQSEDFFWDIFHDFCRLTMMWLQLTHYELWNFLM